MGLDQTPGLDAAAQQVDKIVKASPSIEKITPQQEAAKIREQMRSTKEGMEKARERFGNFCVSIGNDVNEGNRTKVVMLTQPVAGTGRYEQSMNYIFVTDEGFKQLVYYPKEVANPQTSNQGYTRAALDRLKQAIDEAVKGDGIIADGNDSGYTSDYLSTVQIGKGVLYDPERPYLLGSGVGTIIETDSSMVEQAVQASINAVRGQNQALLDKTAKSA